MTDATFVPKVLAEYEGIALVRRSAAVKGTAATPRAESAAPPKK